MVDRLDCGGRGLLKLLQSTASSEVVCKMLEENEQKTKILLFCALFDDSLSGVTGDDDDDDDDDGSSSNIALKEARENSHIEQVTRDDSSTITLEADIVRAALLRDTLFFVGNYSLSLAISCEFYHRYPNASSGDMHLLLACACSDDVLAYIAIKNGIHKFMYDEESDTTSKILAEMMISDARGLELWKKKGKEWILSGGVEEFRNRCQMIPCSKNQDELYPKYEGLAGGRFHGHRDKLPNDMSEDLAFSMKAIAGSLVLSLGLESMWQCLGPLFEELLILSPDDLRREYSHISDLPNNYHRGRR
eukprot:15323925-Ditylum_brightwellii.AAC.1